MGKHAKIKVKILQAKVFNTNLYDYCVNKNYVIATQENTCTEEYIILYILVRSKRNQLTIVACMNKR